jgi:ankyrin repeat protein
MNTKAASLKEIVMRAAAADRRLGQGELFKFVKACWSGDANAVKRWLRDGADPNAMCERIGRRPLNAAAADGRVAVARLLLDAGADPNLPDSWKAMPPNGTPLENACRKGHLEVAKLLVDRGADVDMKGLHTPLWTAASCGHSDVVEFLLHAGALFDQSAFGQAVSRGEPKTVALLLEAGTKTGAADVNARNDVGEALVHDAAMRKSADVMKLLLAAGADVNVASTLQKQTPLHVAARCGQIEVLRVLVDAGASLDALNHKKKTAEQWARAFEHPEAAAFLKSCRKGSEGKDAAPKDRKAKPRVRRNPSAPG